MVSDTLLGYRFQPWVSVFHSNVQMGQVISHKCMPHEQTRLVTLLLDRYTLTTSNKATHAQWERSKVREGGI